ncbi:MAG TPA: methionyl-tRNA formyltransferase [Gaiellaceae bacterium]|nr:methionyl-tRNA formyltransferase [Gaiellaceae bacterium]
MPLAVAATAPFGADVLERLAADHDVAALLTRPDRPKGRGRRPGPPPAKEAAERLGIPVLQPERLDASLELPADTIVVVAYGALIPDALLDRALWLNVHPSLLPRWRGAAPVERAIMAGEEETGVTIHRTTAELDAGPIAAQRAFPIGAEDDAGAVYARAAEVAAELLDDVLASEPAFVPQPEEGATYAPKLTPADRELDWSRPPQELLNRIRALSPHVGARGELHGRPVTVWKARLDDGRLVPVEVQPDGRRRMSYDEFLRGLR